MFNYIKYIILNYYYSLIHYNKYKNTMNYINNTSYLVEYIDIGNYSNARIILMCAYCNYPLLKVSTITKCKCQNMIK